MSDLGILIPLAGIGCGALAIWTKHQRRLAEMGMTATAEKAAQYASQHRALEERVRVLERIITDGGFDTAVQIEALRDRRAGESAGQERPPQ